MHLYDRLVRCAVLRLATSLLVVAVFWWFPSAPLVAETQAVRRDLAYSDSITDSLIAQDANVDPASSHILASAFLSGHFMDLATQWCGPTPPGTFRQGVPFEGMAGPGVTRIDTIVANEAASESVASFRYRWDWQGHDHVPLQVSL